MLEQIGDWVNRLVWGPATLGALLVLNASGDFDVRILFVGRSFLLADELRAVVLDARFAVTVFHVQWC